MAIGEMIEQSTGKITGQRVLPDGKMEITVQANGKVLGLEASYLVTFWGQLRPSGVIYGEGDGMVMTKDGDMVSFHGSGIGKPKGRAPAASWRYSVNYQTASQKLSRLNSVVGLGEFEVAEDGSCQDKRWEWK